MDKLSFCREYLHKLTFDELASVYNILSLDYDDGECIFENDIKYIESIFDMMYHHNLTQKDWIESISNGKYNPKDKYIGIGGTGIYSYNNIKGMLYFVDKKLNGEAMEMVEGYLWSKGIINSTEEEE